MKKYIVILFIIFLHLYSYGQGTSQALNTTKKIDSLVSLAQQYMCRDLKKSDSLNKILISESKRLNYPIGIAFALKFDGTNKICLGKNDSAEVILKESLKYFKQANYTEEYIKTLNNLSAAFRNQAKFDSAKVHLREMIQLSGDHNFELLQAYGFTGIGSLFIETGDFDSVIYYGMKSLELAKKMEDKKNEGNALMNIASAFFKLDDHDNAYKYYLQGVKLLQEGNDIFNLSTIYYNIAGLHIQFDNVDSALFYFEKALNGAAESNNAATVYQTYHGLADLYYRQGLFQKSIDYALKALVEGRKQKNRINEPEILNTLSSSYVAIGNVQKAIEMANESIKLSDSLGFKNEKAQAYKYLSQGYSLSGDYSRALNAHLKFYEYQKEIVNEQKNEAIAELQTKYETEKVEAEKVLAENRADLAESESQRNRLFFMGAVVVALLVVLVAVIYISRQKQAKRAEIATLELMASQKQLALEKQYRDSELKALKAQMNPHFIFNVLNSIQEFIVMNKKELASDYLATFAELIRSYLHFSNKGFISLKEETETLERYLELEALRFGDSFIYQVNVVDDLRLDELEIPTMIIQPYVENAIKHGLFSKKGEKKITIDFSNSENGELSCSITDNGIGRQAAQQIKASKPDIHKSFAMEATASRLELFNQRSNNKISVEIIDLFDEQNQPSGTQVKLIIPSQS